MIMIHSEVFTLMAIARENDNLHNSRMRERVLRKLLNICFNIRMEERLDVCQSWRRTPEISFGNGCDAPAMRPCDGPHQGSADGSQNLVEG